MRYNSEEILMLFPQNPAYFMDLGKIMNILKEGRRDGGEEEEGGGKDLFY